MYVCICRYVCCCCCEVRETGTVVLVNVTDNTREYGKRLDEDQRRSRLVVEIFSNSVRVPVCFY